MNKLRLNHFILLVGMMAIALFTSATNLMADNYDVTITGTGFETVAPVETSTLSFTLVASEGYKLPEALTTVQIEDALATAEVGTEAGQYIYNAETGVVTFGKGTTMNNVTITANAVAKGTDATLKSLSYSLNSEADVVIELTEEIAYTIDLGKYVSAKQQVSFKAETTDALATVEANPITVANISDEATITVTAENGKTKKTYTITFNSKDRLSTVTAPAARTLTTRYATADEAVEFLNGQGGVETATVTCEKGKVKTLPITWSFSAEKNDGKEFDATAAAVNQFTWTVDASSVDNKDNVSLTGETAITNTAATAVITLSALTYQVGEAKPIVVTGFLVSDDEAKTYSVALPHDTPADAVITIAATTTDPNATVTSDPEDMTVTLAKGSGSIVLTVTAENGQATRKVTIEFTTDVEKVTKVEVPATYKLEAAQAAGEEGANAVIEILNTLCTLESNGETKLSLEWKLSGDAALSTYNNAAGETNTFAWTVKGLENAVEGVALKGETVVTNFMPAVTESKEKVEINNGNPVDKIGDGETMVEIGEVAISAPITDLTINQAVIEKLTLTSDVTGLDLFLAGSENTIEKIVNAGVLTLKNAATELRAATTVENTGAVKAVENNKTFTDETATILVVTGAADVTLGTLPKGGSTTRSEMLLEVMASSSSCKLAYQWQKDGEDIEGATFVNFTVDKATLGNGDYRCKVTATNESATTVLYTPAVQVSFTSTPTPEVKSYTVSLPAVAGATFDKEATTKVDEGGDFSFKITLDKAYDQSKPVVKVGDEVIEADATGVYTIKNITKDITISVTGIVKNVPTGIEEIAEGSKVYARKGEIVIELTSAMKVQVVGLSGARVFDGQVNGVQRIQAGTGLYMVCLSDGKVSVTEKIVVR